jgi:DNA-binding PadR family transcriptional regulator
MHSPVNWALLGLIIERPSYAFELATRFKRTYEGAIAISSPSHIYTALGTLRERGLVEQMEEAPTRQRRRFRATPEGVAEHAEWMTGQVAEERRRQRVLMAQLGALAHNPEQALSALDAYEQACIAEMSGAPAPGSDEGPGVVPLVARLAAEETRLSIAARLRWVQYARGQLSAMAPERPSLSRDG